METIAIFCESLEPDGEPFKDPYYWDAYSDLVLILQELGARAYFTTDNSTYIGEGVFTKGYTLLAKGPVESMRKMGEFKADLVFDRGLFTGSGVKVLNPEFVSRVGEDKITTYELFGHFQPFSVPCYSKSELLKAFDNIDGNLIVVKEPKGCGGHGVYIGTRQEVLREIPDIYPLLAQEYMDTSVSYPGYKNGIADMRIEVGGGEIWGCYIRIPKPGSYKANVAQGGSKIILTHNDVPKDLLKIVKEIDSYFKGYPRFYGVDFAHTIDGWKLIEINTVRLGIVAMSAGPGSKYTLYKLANYLIDNADKK